MATLVLTLSIGSAAFAATASSGTDTSAATGTSTAVTSSAATDTSTGTQTGAADDPSGKSGGQRSDETLLTGDALAKVQAAAVAKVGSDATVVRAETDADGNAKYEVHMKQADGTQITAASDSMARGDLSVRANVDRADEIGSLAGSFNAMADTTQRTVSALRRFVADAAHELGTPLTALQADLELAQDQNDGPGRERFIRRAMSQAERIQHLSSDLLCLSRLDTGNTPMPMAPVELASLVRGLADTVASRADQAGIDFLLDLPLDCLWVKGSAEGLRTAIGSLIDNALKFTPAGGSVVLGAKADGRTAVISVEDTGIGIPAADLDGLFSRFHRGRNAAAYPGSGLGLAIVQATMEVHGDTVSVQSRTIESGAVSGPTAGGQTSGSRFELRLPLL